MNMDKFHTLGACLIDECDVLLFESGQLADQCASAAGLTPICQHSTDSLLEAMQTVSRKIADT